MKPLSGLKVVDLTHALAGPFCTYQLALLGAEVIKIENPGVGDDFRAGADWVFEAVNAGKASVTLNLKHRGALSVLQRLIESADVMVDNFKPGTAAKFGLTWDVVHAWNPQLIWASISGFGLEGPWRDLPAVEWSVQAGAGLSENYLSDDADPRDLGLPVLDISTGHAAVTAILAALIQRGKTGQGQHLDVAMLDIALTYSTGRVDTPRRLGRRPAVGRFKAKDRRLFVMGAHQRWFKTLSDVLGSPHLIDDPRFADPAARQAHAGELRQALEERLAARTADDWAAAFTAAGLPAAVVRTIEEVVGSPHVQARGTLHRVKVEERGDEIVVVGTPFHLGDGAPQPSSGVPALGQHTEAVLVAAGYGEGEVSAMREDGLV